MPSKSKADAKKTLLCNRSSVRHIVALAIAGIAVYRAHAFFIERRPVSELALPGMGRELGIGLLVGAGLYAACELILMAMGYYRIIGEIHGERS